MDDVARALAFVARRQGRAAMPASQWSMVLSLDLGWMPPAKAQAFVARAQAAGLLEPEGDALALRADPTLVELPLGFRPDPDAIPSTGAADPFVEWLGRVAKARGTDRPGALALVTARQESLAGLLDAQAAVLWLAAESGLDVRQAALDHVKALTGGRQAPAPAARP